MSLCCPFLTMNLMWASYVIFMRFTLPDYLSRYLMDAIRGVADNIHAKTREAVKESAKKGVRGVKRGSIKIKEKVQAKRRR